MSRFQSGDEDFIKHTGGSKKFNEFVGRLKPKAKGMVKKVKLTGKALADKVFTQEEKDLLDKIGKGHPISDSDMVLIKTISEKQKKHFS